MRKVSRSEDNIDVNVKDAMTKESVNLNVVHDVATMAPHALNALKDVGHAVGQGVGHAIDWAKDTITRPIHDVQNYGKDVQNFAESLDNGQHLGPTVTELSQARQSVDPIDAGHAISAIGVGSAGTAGIAKGIGMGINKAIDTFGDRKTVRDKNRFLRRHPIIDKFSSFDNEEEQFSEINFRTAQEKDAVNLNIVHDVAQMAPHVWNGIKDVGHGIADVARGVGHGVSSIGHHDLDLAKTVGEAFTSNNPSNSPDNINHVLYNYLSSPSVGRFPKGTPNHEIYNIVQHWRTNGGPYGGNALHNYPGLDKMFPGQGKASGEIISQDLKNKFDAMNNQGENRFMADVGSAALTGLVPAAIGLGIKQHRDNKFSSRTFNSKLATDDEKGHYKYIHKDGSEWVVVQKGTGKILSRHKTEDDAIASFKAMMVSKHGSVVEAKTWPKNKDDSVPTPENPWYKSSVSGPEEWDYLHEDPEEHEYGSTVFLPTSLDSLSGFPKGMKINLPYKTRLGSYIGVRHHPDKGLWEAFVGEAGPGGKEMHSSFHSTREDAMSKAHEAWRIHFPRVFEGEHFSSKTAGAWPSDTDWEKHLRNLEELLAETQKGVGWHAAKGETKEMKAHDKLAKDLQKSIDDIKQVMKFPGAKTASADSDDNWRDEHSNLDSDW